MNTHDVPMILFTVVTQMCVGAFLVLGTAHVGAAIRGRENSVVERTSRPVLYAIGPAMVFGLFVSMFHMGYPAHTLNVLRHPQTSWLSREIMFGSGFALLGFVFAMLSWFKRPTFAIQRVLAVFTAIVGIGLLVCESMIYYSLVTVPAWHNWWVPFSFAATTIILGTLSVACALMITAMVRHSHEAAGPSAREKHPKTTGWWSRHVTEEIRAINAPTDDQEWDLSLTVTKWCSIGAAVVSVALMVGYPLYTSQLASGGPVAHQASNTFSGGIYATRLILLGVIALMLGSFVYRGALHTPREHPHSLGWLLIITLIITFAGEIVGRALHYWSLVRIGI